MEAENTEAAMSCFYVDIALENLGDVYEFKRGHIGKAELRTIESTKAFVDTGAWTLTLTEDAAKDLGLEYKEKQISEVAGGREAEGYIAEPPVRVKYAGHSAVVEAFVLPGQTHIILGALPMEIMDVTINPKQETLVPKNSPHYIM
jgi:predicted aspartyl protease